MKQLYIAGTSGDMPGLTQIWGNLQQNLFSQQYESSAFANIFSGGSQGVLLHQPNITSPSTTFADSPFRCVVVYYSHYSGICCTIFFAEIVFVIFITLKPHLWMLP